MMKPDLRVVKTKRALHEALVELLRDRTLEQVTISELCRVGNVNRGTFYLHYGRIEDVFEEYFQEITADLAKSYEEPYRHVKLLNPRELEPSTIRIFHHIKTYVEFYRIVFSKNVPLAYYYMLFDEVRKLLLRDTAALKRNDIDHDLLCSYQANAIVGMIIYWAERDFQTDPSEMNEQLANILRLDSGRLV
ncbi:TetR/AcrR family transcriptional regulator [Exiguobacterium sp. SH1S21]|uniref:TetR/AcrR family transcriptional regulator n=1 Tax=Exiguobacterium sp. SH1S21 TaxID=2510953 RepID=UPI001039545C|nr:TetR-like C-terminal domain-containing protein [Exiguobacterium sp. SH1S21]TCI57841.1 TetR/AcrR family transcriptional regulator [Exiguobacterium sp. SH1S21]